MLGLCCCGYRVCTMKTCHNSIAEPVVYQSKSNRLLWYCCYTDAKKNIQSFAQNALASRVTSSLQSAFGVI
jgi:hypothetical protein